MLRNREQRTIGRTIHPRRERGQRVSTWGDCGLAAGKGENIIARSGEQPRERAREEVSWRQREESEREKRSEKEKQLHSEQATFFK